MSGYNICIELDKESLAKEISENILYNQKQLGLSEIKKIIELLELDAKTVGKKLSKINENPIVLIWIQDIGSIQEVSKALAPSYLKKNIYELDNDLTLKYLSLLKNNSKDVQDFAKKYLEEISVDKISSDIAIECLKILKRDLNEYTDFFLEYIKYLTENIDKIDDRLTSKILKELDENSDIVEHFAKKYIQQEFDLLDDYICYKCLNILNNDSEDIQIFAKKYLEKDISVIQSGIAIECLKILEKDTKETEDFAEKYINESNPNFFLLNSSLAFLAPNNKIRKIFSENVLRNKSKLHSYPHEVQAQIISTEIDNKNLREKNALDILYFLKRKFTNRDKKFFINNRTLYNACLLVFEEKPYEMKKFSLNVLDYWEEEIKFRVTKPNYKYYHLHIITSLKNPEIENESIAIAKKILKKDNELNKIAVKNEDKKHFFMSYQLDDAIHNLIKKDIEKSKNNKKRTKQILSLLKDSMKIRSEFRKMNSEIKYGSGSGNGRYIQSINILSFFAKVHNGLKVAIQHKEHVISMIEEELAEDYNENWEDKLNICKEELNIWKREYNSKPKH